MALAAALGLAAAPAAAHFLWVGIEPGAGHTVRLTFGETPEELTQAVPVARLAQARVRDAAGAWLTLAEGSGAFTGALAGVPAVTATESWGVVDREGDGSGAFLLEYYAKGGAGPEQAALDLGLPLEVLARQDGTRVTVSVRRAGSGVEQAPVHVHLPDGRTLVLTADAAGEVTFDAVDDGLYGIRSRWIEDRQGESEGQAYGEVRHYATLTFSVGAPPAPAQPGALTAASAPAASTLALTAAPGNPAGDSAPASADPAAYALLKGAHDSRQVMPADFPGFRCDLVFQKGDETFEGQLEYRRQGETEVRIDGLDAPSLEWVHNQVLNLVGHRRGGDFAQGDGRYPLQLGPEDSNPYGRLIIVNDDMQSSYRVRDDRVLEVTRTMDGSCFTISVIETMDADPGKYLANHFVVAYRDAATGMLSKFEGYRDHYAHVDGVWLPTSRTILEVTDSSSPVVRTLRFRKLVQLAEAELDEPAEAPAAGEG